VTMVIRRPFGVFVGLAATVALLAGCASGPSQVGSALIVGDTSVSDSQVQGELRDMLASQQTVQQALKQGNLDQTSRAIVTSHVLHVLIGRAAAQNGLTVSDQQVDQLISEQGGQAKVAEGLATTRANVHGAVKDLLLEVALTRKFANTLSVTFGFVESTGRADAIAKAQRLAADPAALPGMVAQANKVAQAAGGQSGGATDATFSIVSYLAGLQQSQQAAAAQGQQAPMENDGPLLGSPANTVVAFQPSPQAAPIWVVALIKSRDVNGAPQVPAGQANPVDTASPATLQQIGVSLLESEVAKTGGIRISPRYGVWDTVGMQVSPSANQTVGVEFPVQPKPAA
jgi:SurA-like protein